MPEQSRSAKPAPAAPRTPSALDWVVFCLLATAAIAFFLYTERSDIHSTFSNLVAAWNQ